MLLFLSFRFLDFIDIILVALLLQQMYRLTKGTVAINIIAGLALLYTMWLVVKALDMLMLSAILGQFAGVGVLAIIIVFQQEIRRFLLIIGARYIKHRFRFSSFLGTKVQAMSNEDIAEIVTACTELSRTSTGALIVINCHNDLPQYVQTGTVIGSRISGLLLQNIFYNKAPLHDGAVIISRNRISAAGCILPSSESDSLPSQYGMRHRAALGMSEETESLILVVSEETGRISYAIKGSIRPVNTPEHLRSIIQNRLN